MRSRWMALIATTPPFRRQLKAAITTSPDGANVTARSSATGGLSVSAPTHVAPSDSAKRRCDAPRALAVRSHSDNLMSGNDGVANRRQLAFDDVQVGAAHAASPDAQQYMPVTLLWPWHAGDPQRPVSNRPRRAQNRCSHPCCLFKP